MSPSTSAAAGDPGVPQPQAETSPVAVASTGQEKGALKAALGNDASLAQAFFKARHAFLPLTPEESALISNTGVRTFAANPEEDLVMRCLDEGIRLGSGILGRGWSLEFSSIKLARGDWCHETSPIRMEQLADRVSYHREGMVEWYENKAEGFEQGFTIGQRPASAGNEAKAELHLSMKGLKAAADPADADRLIFSDQENRPVLAYQTLRVWDADGRELPSAMGASNSSVTLSFDDTGARYPVTVDPLIVSLEKTVIQAEGEGGPTDGFGSSVALNGDTAVIGAHGYSASGAKSGSVYVFIRTGETWAVSQRIDPLVRTSPMLFGAAVAFDGTYLAIAASQETTAQGAYAGSVHVYSKTAGAWSREAQLTGDQASGYFGGTVVLSGQTLLIGASGEKRAYVFVRGAGGWTRQTTLQAGGGVSVSYPSSLALEGDTAIVSDSWEDNGPTYRGGWVYSYVRSGTTWTQQQRFTCPPNQSGGNFRFGEKVALSGSRLAVSMIGDSAAAGFFSGSAYVYNRSGSTWLYQAKLLASDPASGQCFGSAIAIEGTTVVVGASDNENTGPGNAYVYDWSGSLWSQTAKLSGSGGRSRDNTGAGVALYNGVAVIASPGFDSDAGQGSGGAYIFVKKPLGWVEQALLNNGDNAAGDRFGTALAVDGDRLAIGAIGADTVNGGDSGAVYLFVKDGGDWNFKTRLNGGGSSGEFGQAIALKGDRMIVGEPGRSYAYVYEYVGGVWTQQAVLQTTDRSMYDDFGISLSMDGDQVAIGASLDDVGSVSNAGSVTIFRKSGTWSQQGQVFSDVVAGNQFGRAVRLRSGTLLAGAPNEKVGTQTNAGCAYIFTETGGVWSRQGKLADPVPSSSSYFGRAVELGDNFAVIGAYNKDTVKGPYSGQVFIYARNGSTWDFQSSILPGDGKSSDGFGISLALEGDVLAVGVPGADSTSESVGVVRIYKRSQGSWVQQAKLFSDSGVEYEHFGTALALNGSYLVVGGPDRDILRSNGTSSIGQGTAYFYSIQTTRSFSEWAADAGLTGQSADMLAVTFADGIPNLLKYAFNLNGAAADGRRLTPITGTAGLPVIAPVAGEDGERLRIEFLRRKGVGLTYTAFRSSNLHDWEPCVSTPAVTPVDSEWERVILLEPRASGDDPLFARVKVIAP